MAPSKEACPHRWWQTEVSPYAAETKYIRPDARRRAGAVTSSGRAPSTPKATLDAEDQEQALTFPAPLIFPDDDLALDPKYPAQSVRQWIQEKERNKLTEKRKAIYVAALPAIDPNVSFVKSWASPIVGETALQAQKKAPTLKPPAAEDIQQYLAAFYHGMPVKLLPKPFRFVRWDKDTSSAPAYIGISHGTSCTRVRTRACPDKTFKRQLNLNDILDAEIEALPEDAYAIVLLTEHDLYEDEEDDFCCGRAYGGSRIAVVSAARYHPWLDGPGGVDRAHMWPASHCRMYFERHRGNRAWPPKAPTLPPKETTEAASPLRAAMLVARDAPDPSDDLRGLWFSRVVRTVSHELGHCLGMDHCVYYACVMQGTAGMAEDVRQPPYLCPVCLKKFTLAVMECTPARSAGEGEFQRERYAALSAFCEGWKHVAMFAGFQRWLDGRLAQLAE